MKFLLKPERFWTEIAQIENSATPFVLKRTLVFGMIAVLITAAEKLTDTSIAVPLTPYEILGAALGALLVLRTNAGYERWWEGRRLWGAIINDTRNLAIEALAHGPNESEWRRRIVSWTAAYAHVVRRSLRGQRAVPELVPLLGIEASERLARAEHMPTAVAPDA